MNVRFQLYYRVNPNTHEYIARRNKCVALLREAFSMGHLEASDLVDAANKHPVTITLTDAQYGRFMALRRLRSLSQNLVHSGGHFEVFPDRTQQEFDLRPANAT